MKCDVKIRMVYFSDYYIRSRHPWPKRFPINQKLPAGNPFAPQNRSKVSCPDITKVVGSDQHWNLLLRHQVLPPDAPLLLRIDQNSLRQNMRPYFFFFLQVGNDIAQKKFGTIMSKNLSILIHVSPFEPFHKRVQSSFMRPKSKSAPCIGSESSISRIRLGIQSNFEGWIGRKGGQDGQKAPGKLLASE